MVKKLKQQHTTDAAEATADNNFPLMSIIEFSPKT